VPAIRPAYVLSLLIILGWIIGVIGDLTTVCPAFPSGLACDTATFYMAQYNLLVVNYHNYFQLFTSILVTDVVIDAAFNAIAVLILDRFASDSFNYTRYFAIFFGSALLGNVITLLWGPEYISAGASGGIFGLYAAVFSFAWAEEKRIDATTLAIFALIFFTSSFLLPNVNWLAHLGGSIGGFIAGPLLYLALRPKLASYSPNLDSTLMSKIVTALVLIVLTVASAVQFLVFAL